MKMLAFVVLAACGDDSLVSRDARTVEVEQKPKPKPVDLSLAPGLEMRHPIRDGNLTIIPIVTTATIPDVHYVTLADGVANRSVTVREIARGENFQVDHVRVRNRGTEPLFVMTGELIFDGLQDRAIAEDRIIAPGTRADIEVRCVEQGRETGHMEFRASGLLAELRLRRQIIYGEQFAVWTEVWKLDVEHQLTPATKTYRGVAELQQTTDPMARRDALARQLAALPDRTHLVGLASVSGDRVMTLEQFATPELYGRLESELLGSYIASDEGPPHEGRTLLPDDVRAANADTHRRVTHASTIIVVGP